MRFLTYLLILFFQQSFSQQNEVSITIDDVPNVELHRQDGKSLLLERITEMNIPVAIFINEKNIYKNPFKSENVSALEMWLKNKNITAGNHSYSHPNYADTTLEGFQQDIIDGEKFTTQILKRRPGYFRFPFNSLGNDSIGHIGIKKFLKDRGYTLTPFTIESEDWAYNAVYENALKNGNTAKAKEIGRRYLNHTLAQFEYFENLAMVLYGRNIKHIYLCHDNPLNTDYISELIEKLKERKYKFISLDEALRDDVYSSREYYFGRHGFSWVYRWEKNETKRKKVMQGEPSNEALQNEYNSLER